MATLIKLKQLQLGTSGQLIEVNGSGVPTYVNKNTINLSSFNNDSGFITSAALSPYLTSATAALTYQPLDSDLTSWAGVTRASGFDTFVITPSSANLSSLLTDKTGTGVNVFGTQPTFTTDIKTPLIYGSTSASGNLVLESTSNATKGRILFQGVGTNDVSIQGLVGTLTIPAIYMGVAAPSATNYSIWGNGDSLVLNTPGANAVAIRSANNQIVTFSNTAFSFSPRVATTGSVNTFSFSIPANTGQTASTAVPGTLFTHGQRTWANGGAATTITTQKEFEIRAPQYSTSGGGSLTITDAYTFYVDKPTLNGVTATNNHAAGFNGSVEIISGRLEKSQGADVSSTNNLVLGTDGNVFEITGTTQINLISNISWKNGCSITLLFTSTPTVKHNQATSGTNITIQLAGAVDFVASAGDTLTLVLSEIGGTQAWREISRAVI